MWCSIKRVTKLAVAKVSYHGYPSKIPAIVFISYLLSYGGGGGGDIAYSYPFC